MEKKGLKRSPQDNIPDKCNMFDVNYTDVFQVGLFNKGTFNRTLGLMWDLTARVNNE